MKKMFTRSESLSWASENQMLPKRPFSNRLAWRCSISTWLRVCTMKLLKERWGRKYNFNIVFRLPLQFTPHNRKLVVFAFLKDYLDRFIKNLMKKILLFIFLASAFQLSGQSYDVLIKNGKIID